VGLRAIVVRCPNCNANLEIASTVASVTCAYCGTVSRIQARTAVFQTPKPMSRTEPQLPQMPVARQRFSVLLAMLPTLIIAGLVAGGTFFAKRGIPGLISSRVLWAGHVPVLIDVDGDGVADPIGLVRYVMSNDRAHLAAYSGKTGAPLWESEPLGNYSELGQLQFAAMGPRLHQ